MRQRQMELAKKAAEAEQKKGQGGGEAQAGAPSQAGARSRLNHQRTSLMANGFSDLGAGDEGSPKPSWIGEKLLKDKTPEWMV